MTLSESHDSDEPTPFTRKPPWANFQGWLQWVFQIGLPDEKVRAAATVGELYLIIAEELRVAYETDDESADRSLTTIATQHLRDAMEILYDMPRAMMSPGAEMEELIPRPRRRDAWEELAEEMNLRLPEIEIAEHTIQRSGVRVRSAFKTFVASLLVLGLGAAMSAGTSGQPQSVGNGLLALGGCGIAVSFLLFIASTFGGQDFAIPRSCQTIGDTVLTLICLNPIRLGWGRLTGLEIWQVLQVALADRFDLPVDHITRDLPLADEVMRSELPPEDL